MPISWLVKQNKSDVHTQFISGRILWWYRVFCVHAKSEGDFFWRLGFLVSQCWACKNCSTSNTWICSLHLCSIFLRQFLSNYTDNLACDHQAHIPKAKHAFWEVTIQKVIVFYLFVQIFIWSFVMITSFNFASKQLELTLLGTAIQNVLANISKTNDIIIYVIIKK